MREEQEREREEKHEKIRNFIVEMKHKMLSSSFHKDDYQRKEEKDEQANK